MPQGLIDLAAVLMRYPDTQIPKDRQIDRQVNTGVYNVRPLWPQRVLGDEGTVAITPGKLTKSHLVVEAGSRHTF